MREDRARRRQSGSLSLQPRRVWAVARNKERADGERLMRQDPRYRKRQPTGRRVCKAGYWVPVASARRDRKDFEAGSERRLEALEAGNGDRRIKVRRVAVSGCLASTDCRHDGHWLGVEMVGSVELPTVPVKKLRRQQAFAST